METESLIAAPVVDFLDVENVDGSAKVQSICHDSGEESWALRFSHLDSQENSLRWTTEIAIRRDDLASLDVVVLVLVSRLGEVIAPINRAPSRPNIVIELLDSFPCAAGLPLQSKLRKIGGREVDWLVQQVRSSDRQRPIVVNSVSDQSGRSIVWSDRLADQLAGLAHVYELDNKFIPGELRARGLPSDLICEDGCVGIYWPGIGNKSSLERWAAHEILQLRPQRVSARITEIIATAAVAQQDQSEPSWVWIENELRRKRLGELLQQRATDEANSETDAGELEELFDAQAREIEQLELDKKQLDMENGGLRSQIYNLQVQLDAFSKGSPVVGAEMPREFSTLEEACDQAAEIFSEALVFALNSRSCVKGNPFERPEEAFKAFEFLADTYASSRASASGYVDFDQDLRERCGWQYRSSQAQSTMKKYRDDYTTSWNGKTYWLEAHLRTGSSKDPRHSLRIAFDWASEERKVVIGYIGQHQRTDAT